jgi:uncharacterized protein
MSSPERALDPRRNTAAHSSLPYHRLLSLDVARGLAVIVMIFDHFVPVEDPLTLPQRLSAVTLAFLEPPTLALFCVPVGMTLVLQYQRFAAASGAIARRALVLIAAGIVMHLVVWWTEILAPLGLMMLIALALISGGKKALLLANAALLVAIPPMFAWAGHYGSTDWLQDGTHIGERSLSWATFRFVTYDGHYPLLPLTGYVLTGASMTLWRWNDPERVKKWFWGGLIVASIVHGITVWAARDARIAGFMAPYLTSKWTPTTLPFIVLSTAAAIAVLAGFSWAENRGVLTRVVAPIASFGRASLTHYLLHICAVYAALRLWFPDEDWPLSVGLPVAVGYLAFALPATSLWFRRFSRGPLEILWDAASGTRSRHS